MSEEEDNVLPLKQVGRVIAEVGGLIDELGITLAVYGDSLRPDEITTLLGVLPTSAHSRGDRKSPNSPPFPTGAWLLSQRGRAPESPADVIRKLLGALPAPESDAWETVRSKYVLQLRFGIHMSGWNQGFSLEPDVVESLARLGVSLEFDIYADGDGE